ncbi:hypothetical protein [Mesorhizobium sp. CAU 1732]|uniref:hypothetical protein n=1 Tax=Mesorhizobium sp. CAU 1732 TaxID=3140358 RepID=UPI0032605FA7
MTHRPTHSRFGLIRALPRVALLTAALFAPLIAMQAVEASSDTIIVQSMERVSGAGIVLIAGLRRA